MSETRLGVPRPLVQHASGLVATFAAPDNVPGEAGVCLIRPDISAGSCTSPKRERGSCDPRSRFGLVEQQSAKGQKHLLPASQLIQPDFGLDPVIDNLVVLSRWDDTGIELGLGHLL